MRTTLDIERLVLKELREIQKREGGTLGSIASRLLAEALGRSSRRAASPAFRWTARKMEASVDLADKDAVYAILDRADHAAEP
ncbi:MAG: antitoxin [Acidobacteria bacterium]|nr:MAG: antitoxin [Acidobacteriota bacterium]